MNHRIHIFLKEFKRLYYLYYFVLLVTLNVLIIFTAPKIFALEISPNLIYQVETVRNDFSYSFFVKNDIPSDSIINIEIIDFITDGKNYVFDDPNYEYSLRRYVSVREKNFTLNINQKKEVIVDFNVPSTFPGATGIFALKISQESASGGQVQLRLTYIVPFFVRFKNTPVVQSIKILELNVRNLFKDPDENYGNFGSLVTILLENNGNIAFIPKGTIKLSSRDLKTTITDVPFDSFDFVVFPKRRGYYTFHIPYVLPKGTIDISLSGKSYNIDFYISSSLLNNDSGTTTIENVYRFNESIILFDDKSKNALQSITVENLSYMKENILLSVNGTENGKFSFVPKRSTIHPYKITNFNIRSLEKDYNFSGDKIYTVSILDENSNQRKSLNTLYLILRGNVVNPQIKAYIQTENNNSMLVVENIGDCVLEFNVLFNGKVINENKITIFPGQRINLDFGRTVQSTGFSIEYNMYKDQRKYISDLEQR